MSLDVYLYKVTPACSHCGREEERTCLYTDNITHNLNTMAGAADIYMHLWRPDEIGITTASQLIAPLKNGLNLLKSWPDRFKAQNPSNGWGTYEGLCGFVSDYLKACEAHPDALVEVSR